MDDAKLGDATFMPSGESRLTSKQNHRENWETHNRADRDTKFRATRDSQRRLDKKSLSRATRDSISCGRRRYIAPGLEDGSWCGKAREKLASGAEGTFGVDGIMDGPPRHDNML